MDDRTTRAVTWQRAEDGEHPFVAYVDGETWRVRVNDFPAEPLYTLLVGGAPVEDLEDWPPTWIKPV